MRSQLASIYMGDAITPEQHAAMQEELRRLDAMVICMLSDAQKKEVFAAESKVHSMAVAMQSDRNGAGEKSQFTSDAPHLVCRSYSKAHVLYEWSDGASTECEERWRGAGSRLVECGCTCILERKAAAIPVPSVPSKRRSLSEFVLSYLTSNE
jgi:hypothetical protein